jgi:pyridoxamine 5'-phosphate oxidase
MDALFTTAPDFDQPIAVLKHCHDRIRKQLSTLQQLPAHLSGHGADAEAQRAATAVMKYFNQAAVHHHEDEECDLLPMLQATAQGEDAALLQQRIPQVTQEHHQMDAIWERLNRELQAVATGASTSLSSEDVDAFCTAYAVHMQMEETDIAPMAKRIFSAAQMAQLGQAMRARRNITTQ